MSENRFEISSFDPIFSCVPSRLRLSGAARSPFTICRSLCFSTPVCFDCYITPSSQLVVKPVALQRQLNYVLPLAGKVHLCISIAAILSGKGYTELNTFFIEAWSVPR